jgi:hypothetical protein
MAEIAISRTSPGGAKSISQFMLKVLSSLWETCTSRKVTVCGDLLISID